MSRLLFIHVLKFKLAHIAMVNTTVGKYEELVIHSIDKSQINNITFELKGKNGIMGTGVFSLDSTGYYMGGIIDLGGNVS